MKTSKKIIYYVLGVAVTALFLFSAGITNAQTTVTKTDTAKKARISSGVKITGDADKSVDKNNTSVLQQSNSSDNAPANSMGNKNVSKNLIRQKASGKRIELKRADAVKKDTSTTKQEQLKIVR